MKRESGTPQTGERSAEAIASPTSRLLTRDDRAEVIA